MSKVYTSILGNERGNTLLIAVMVMVALTALAIFSARISDTNMATATNEKFHKTNFFKTDGDVEAATVLLIDTLMERGTPANLGANLTIANTDYMYASATPFCPDASNFDVSLIDSGAAGDPDPNYKNTTYIGYATQGEPGSGNANQVADGYHGRGKGMASGGFINIITTRGLGTGLGGSRTRVATRYQYIP